MAPRTERPIVLVDVYDIFRDRNYITQRPYVPLALCYLAGSLKEAGFRVLAKHIRSDRIRETIREIGGLDPLFVGVVNILIGNKLRVSAEFSETLRHSAPEIPIVWGGYFPSAAAELCLAEEYVDLVGIGDGEDLILEIAGYYAGSIRKEHIAGLAFSTPEGDIRSTPPRALRRDLDAYWPDFSYLDFSEYITVHKGEALLQNAMITSRGCPFACTFCCHAAVKTGGWRSHSPDYLKQIIRRLKEKADFKYMTISDDNFGVNKRHMFEVIELFNREDVHPIVFAVRIKGLTADDVKRLSALGVEALFFGAESFIPRKLEIFHKQHTTDDIHRGLEYFAADGAPGLKANVIIGVPSESEAELKKELSLAFRESRFPGKVVMSFSIFFPLPKTPMLESAIRCGFREPTDIEGWSRMDNAEIWDRFSQWNPWMDRRMVSKLKTAWRYNTEILHFPDIRGMGRMIAWAGYVFVYPVFLLARFRIRRLFFLGKSLDFLYLRILHFFWEAMKRRTGLV